ncbi:MAG: nucleoside-diphosphate kinase [archaeon]
MMEKTVILVKHDGVQRGLIGEIIKRFEQRSLKIIAMKLIHPTEELASNHYVMTPAWIEKLGENTRKAAKQKGVELKESNKEIAGKVHKWLKDYLIEGPIVAIAFEGYHAIEIGRKISGPAEPRGAPIGTIRGDFAVESYDLADNKQRPLRNLIHASGNKEEAENELKVWFKEEEFVSYEKKDWQVLH